MEFCLENKLSYTEYKKLTNWINATKEINLISNIKNGLLDDNIIGVWFEQSKISAVCKYENKIVGLITLTNLEAELPENSYEICHCIVEPKFRRIYIASMMVLEIMSYAKNKSIDFLYGRVVPSNRVGIELLNKLNWKIIVKTPCNLSEEFIWFVKDLRKRNE